MLEIADLCIFIRKDKIDPVSFVTLFQLSFDTILHCLFQSHIFWSPLLCYIFNLIFCLWSRRHGLNIECCLTNLVLEYCLCCSSNVNSGCNNVLPDSQIDGANVGPTWGCQDPGGPHVDHSNVAIWAVCYKQIFVFCQGDIGISVLPKVFWAPVLRTSGSWNLPVRMDGSLVRNFNNYYVLLIHVFDGCSNRFHPCDH